MKARHNPFRSTVIEAIPYRFSTGDIHERVRRFEANGFRGSLIGPHGSGKTTLLHELGDCLESEGFAVRRIRVYQEEQGPAWSALRSAGDEGIVLLDGYDELPLVSRVRLRLSDSRFQGLLVTSHGRSHLPILEKCETSQELLSELLNSLTQEACPHLHAAARESFARNAGNIRLVFADLYRLQWQAA